MLPPGRRARTAVVVALLAVAQVGLGMMTIASRSNGDGASEPRDRADADTTGRGERAAGPSTGPGAPAPPEAATTVPAGGDALAAARSQAMAAVPGPTLPVAGTTVPASGPIVLRPPYSDQYRATQCLGGPLERCVAGSSPDAPSGVVALNLVVGAPGGGALPGAGTSQAYSSVVVTSGLDRPAASVTVVVEVLVRSAGVARSVVGVPLPPLPSSSAQVYLEAAAMHGACAGAGCFVQSARTLVELGSGSQTASQQRVILRMVLANPSGRLSAGAVSVSAGLYGIAELGSRLAGEAVPDVGTVTAEVDAVVSSVTLTPAA